MERSYREKNQKKENKSGQQKEEKAAEKKERAKPFTTKDFIGSKYGLLLLKSMEIPFKERNADLVQNNDRRSLYKYLRSLVHLYTSWAQSSPFCGNKRTRAYTLLKEIEVAVKTHKEAGPTANKEKSEKGADGKAAQIREEKEESPLDKYPESVDSFFENTLFDSQSFSLLDTSLTTETHQLQTESISDILDTSEESEESSTDIAATRRRVRKD